MAKIHFPSISQANMYFFRIGKTFLSGQKIFCPGRWTGHKKSLQSEKNSSLDLKSITSFKKILEKKLYTASQNGFKQIGLSQAK